MWRRKQAVIMGRLLQLVISSFLLTALFTIAGAVGEKRVVCYYTNWSVYRPGTAKFNPQNINPYLCTHLIYAFGGLDRENGLRPFDKYQDIEQGGYAKFTGLKTYNKNLKTLLAIGGWNEGSARFSPLVADEERRKEFVRNVVKFLRQNHFDGLDLDWEFPAFRDGGKSKDKENYAQLVQELRMEFDRESSKTGRTRLLLTMAVPAGIEYIDKGYDIPKLNRYLDFMNILSYDYHSSFEPAVNHHSPLYSLEEDNEYNFDAQLSIDYTIKHYLKLGADRDKLVLGIPTYGRSYTLFNPDSTQLGAPADGPGEQGDATREKGYLAYYEICTSLKDDKGWTVEQPKRGAMGPYAYKGNQWVGYDDEYIVKEKAKYVNEKDLGGVMFWTIDNDDFRGKCQGRAYPLIEAGKEMLLGTAKKPESNNDVSSSVHETKTVRPVTPLHRRPSSKNKLKSPGRTTSAVTSTTARYTTDKTSTTPEPPTTPDPGSDFVCKDEGFFPHPRDCKKYFWCLDSGPSNLGIVAHQFTCPSGLFFNKAADSCDFARNVLCKEKKEPKTTTVATTTQPTTTANPRLKLTAATAKSTGIRYIPTTTTTTTTTTELPIEEELEEDDYDHAEEDPQAIKQLIMLIKKLGGVAELEKQLESNSGSDVTTAPISRTLYNKVLTPGKYQSPVFRNGPSGPQNEGLSHTDDGASYRREKPQYVTIRRERPSTEPPSEDSSEERIKYSYQPLNRNRAVIEETEGEEEEETVRPVKPLYRTIERKRPTTQAVPQEDDNQEDTSPVTRSRYTSIQRTRPTTSHDYLETTTSRYVTLRRQRPQQQQEYEEDTSSTPYYKRQQEELAEEEQQQVRSTAQQFSSEEPAVTTIKSLSKNNYRVRVVPVRRPSSRQRGTTQAPTSTEDNQTNRESTSRPQLKYTNRRRVNRFRTTDSTTTGYRNQSTIQPTLAFTSESAAGLAVTTIRPRKFEFPKRTARPSTTLQQPIAEPLLRTTSNPFNDNEQRNVGLTFDSQLLESKEELSTTEDDVSNLPDLANVAVVAIQSLATIPPPPIDTTTYSTPGVLNLPRRTSTVQSIIHHTVPVTSLGIPSQPVAISTSTIRTTPPVIQTIAHTFRGTPRPFSKKRITTDTPRSSSSYITKGRTKSTTSPIDILQDYDADYYAEPVDVPLSGKVRIHNDGYIECLDIGNFPHPFSCKKFISCAKMENDHLLGWEYTCPRGLSFDPIGGICNWSAGLGCKE